MMKIRPTAASQALPEKTDARPPVNLIFAAKAQGFVGRA